MNISKFKNQLIFAREMIMKYSTIVSLTTGIILVFLCAYIYSERNNYSDNFKFSSKGYTNMWEKVDSLSRKGLTRSVLKVVETIYEKAKKEENAPQFVKAIIHKLKFESYIEDESFVKAIKKLSDEIEKTKYPIKPIMHSYIASIYWNYYQNNQWKFNDRSTTINYKESDIRTWSLKHIAEKTISHYLLSLEEKDKQIKTPIDVFDEVLIINNKNIRKLRPSLFDFLAHRAADFFMNEEVDLIRPAFTFEIDSAKYFSQYNTFSKIKIDSKDKFSLKQYALNILQDIIKFHQFDSDPIALIDADLKRLKYVMNHSILETKDSLYLDALLRLKEKFKNHTSSYEIDYEIASLYYRLGLKYNPMVSDSNKWMLKKAHTICTEAISHSQNETFGTESCKYLKSQIETKNMHFNIENYDIPDRSSKVLFTYKNLSKVYVRVVKCDPFWFNSLRHIGREDQIKELRKQNVLKKWSQELKYDGDFQTHKTEIEIPSLPFGFYVVLISSDPDFSYDKQSIAYAHFWKSNISYLKRKNHVSASELYIINRTTGRPLKKVSVQLFYSKYNRSKRKYENIRGETYSTDKNGYLILPHSKDRDYSFLELSLGKDKIHTEQFHISRQYSRKTQTHLKTTFFTDRAIYRPGQTLYFKGLILEKEDDKSSIKTEFSTKITLYDVNNQKIDDIDLVTNKYGTFQGTFTIPTGVLNGRMYIRDDHGYHSIQVEEYKRPKFEVTINPVKGEFKLNDSIPITGLAKSYSGATIDRASFKYRIVRQTVLPIWWGWYFPWYRSLETEMEIKNGVGRTNEKGEFSIKFYAIPDASVSKEVEPKFHFSIYVDVTDINGETRSTQETVIVGYTALNLSINIPLQVNKNSKDNFGISTKNSVGEFQPAKGTINIYSLKKPKRLFRKKIWEKPDSHIMSKDEYYDKYPHDPYGDEDNIQKWEKEKKVFSLPFNTEKDSLFKIKKLKKWEPGQYILEAYSKDKYGEEVKDIKYLTVFSETENTVPVNSFDWFTILKDSGEPGEIIPILFGSKCKDLYALLEIENKDKIISKKWIKVDNEQKKIDIPIKKEYRGNFTVHITFVRENRKYRHDVLITVPYTNKQLDIEFSTFRNKLLPGQKEEWKIHINNSRGDEIAAELLASMYDASLDAFAPNNWNLSIYKMYSITRSWKENYSFSIKNSTSYSKNWNIYYSKPNRTYDRLNLFGSSLGGSYGHGGGYGKLYSSSDGVITGVGSFSAPSKSSSGIQMLRKSKSKEAPSSINSDNESDNNSHQVFSPPVNKNGGKKETLKSGSVKARTNFNESAFFFPNLMTNKKGDIIFSFTMPEALTRWKFMGLAHTKDLKIGQIEKEVITQKDLMVIPNTPRFFREHDKITFRTKIANISDKDLTGTAQLLLFDALSSKSIDPLLNNNQIEQTFSVKKGQSNALQWELTIPEGIQAVTCKVIAKAGKFSDGEEFVLPVLSNRMLVTETLPLPIRGKQSKKYSLEKLVNSGKSKTLKNHKVTLEYTSNPSWYAIQALPYLMEYPYDCSEQIFSRFYANSIASHIANSNPRIKSVFDSWRNLTPDALLSNLEKNQELKSLFLQETPWVLQAKDESKRKQNIALLFDLNRMADELGSAILKLEKLQSSSGGWPWFKGMKDNRYITQHIVAGLGHLDNLGIKDIRENSRIWNMVKKAINYLDKKVKEDYEYLLKINKNSIDSIQPGRTIIHYFYGRSYFLDDISIPNNTKKAITYYKKQIKRYWLENSRYLQGMIALALNRMEIPSVPHDIIKSLKENAIYSEELGMYWKDITSGYYWYQAPIETIVLLIEAFSEVAQDVKSVEAMKTWLLKNKQTNDWKTTRATAEACYALLLKGTDWLTKEPDVEISLGKMKIDPSKMPNVKVEAGTGYFKTSWSGKEIEPEMGSVTVKKSDGGVSWGALYWQYFEQLDKITSHKTPLSLKKKLFKQKYTSLGPIIEPITEKNTLKIGDKVIVRIELRVDRHMEYIHMKDMRAAGFEPINVISSYKYQDGLGYYETTKDGSTNFFISYLPKGTYVFEYPLRVSQSGNFSNGITTIQCMYAPEFASHSEGIRVTIND